MQAILVNVFFLAIINMNRQILHFVEVYASLLKPVSFWITTEAR